jgi:hypothetical protein
VNGKVTLVHRRLWPALARLADRFPAKNMAAIHEEHTSTGAHRVREQPFPGWVPSDVLHAAQHLSADDALAELPGCLRTPGQRPTRATPRGVGAPGVAGGSDAAWNVRR